MAECSVQPCDGSHIAAGECHFGDGPHRSRGLCSFHYFRQLRGVTPLEGPPRKAKHNAKLSTEIVRDIRHMHAHDGLSYAKIAKRYGVSESIIAKAVQRTTWRDVD